MKLSYSFPKVGFQVTANIKEMTLNFIENRMSNAAERSKVGKSSEVPTWFWILQCVILARNNVWQWPCCFYYLNFKKSSQLLQLVRPIPIYGRLVCWTTASILFIHLPEGRNFLKYCCIFFTEFNSILAIYVAKTCLMTFDRYLALVHALKYRMFMTAKRGLLLIISAWVFPATLAFLPFTWRNHISDEDKNQVKTTCTALC